MGLIDGCPHLHAVAKALKADLGVVAKPLGDIRIEPAALAGQGIGKVIVEQRGIRDDTVLDATIDHAIVERDAILVDLTDPIGQNAAPRDRESISVLAALCQQPNILLVTMIEIARDVAVDVIDVLGARVVEIIPLAKPLAILVPSTFALICRRGRTPQEVR